MKANSGSTIAVVDDDASLRRAVRNLLTSVGFQVQVFASAEAFLQSGRLGETDVLVLDLRLGGMSGADLVEHLTVSGTGIPVVMLTAHGDEDVRRRCLSAGAVAFLTKPFQTDALLTAVRSALGPGAASPPTAGGA
jgi:FixJ family two-component response regulator